MVFSRHLAGVVVFGQQVQPLTLHIKAKVPISSACKHICKFGVEPDREYQIPAHQSLVFGGRDGMSNAYNDFQESPTSGVDSRWLSKPNPVGLVAEIHKGRRRRGCDHNLRTSVNPAINRGGASVVDDAKDRLRVNPNAHIDILVGLGEGQVCGGACSQVVSIKHRRHRGLFGLDGLNPHGYESGKSSRNQGPCENHVHLVPEFLWGHFLDRYGVLFVCGLYIFGCGPLLGIGTWLCIYGRRVGWTLIALGLICDVLATGVWYDGETRYDEQQWRDYCQPSHTAKIVAQKTLDSLQLLHYINYMANVLSTDKQIAAISALAEGSSIRSVERMTGVHRDTIMRLGVRVGEGCARLMDAKMRDLPCTRLEMDEIWGFVGKKERNVRLDEPAPVGNVWTFCAIDADTKLVPAFKVGDRGIATARAFVSDVASRMRNRVQISTDGLRAYVEAVESAFGAEVDYAQIVKTYGHEEVSDNRRYSAPEFVSSEKKVITGNPDQRLISTSYVERLNATTRLHMRRLTRLTLAFSKKRENFEAAVALHFAYYNFVKRHNTLRCTPAMAAGVERHFWSVGDLVEAAA